MPNSTVYKVVVIGPESTGKSTLCNSLAKHYHTAWCPEYAREYLIKYGKKYSFADLLTIAQGQIALENTFIEKVAQQKARTPLLFIDTNMYVMKVWCEFVFNNCHQWIIDQIVSRQYDLYLLCDTDLPWVRDELREYPDPETRNRLFHMYKDVLINQGVPWHIISGNNEERIAHAIQHVDTFFRDKTPAIQSPAG